MEDFFMTNKEVVLKFYEEVFNGWDTSHVDEYVKENYKQHNPTVADGRAGFKAFLDKFLSMKPHMEISKIVEEGDMVVVFFKCTMGANGMENKVFDMYRLEDGMLAEHWDCVMHDIGGMECVHENGQF